MTYHRFPPEALNPRNDRPLKEVDLPRLDAGTAVPAVSGHWFVVAPLGTATARDPSPPGPFLSGDGMVYRLSLSHDAEDAHVVVSSGVVDDPTRVADQIVRLKQAGSIEPFRHYGLAVLSFAVPGLTDASASLGARNLMNTALCPVTVAGRDLLLVTYDAGRPGVFDPEKLELVGAVGAHHAGEWRPSMFSTAPFPMVGSTAHPAWDPATKELFLVNHVRDLGDAFGKAIGVVKDVPPTGRLDVLRTVRPLDPHETDYIPLAFFVLFEGALDAWSKQDAGVRAMLDDDDFQVRVLPRSGDVHLAVRVTDGAAILDGGRAPRASAMVAALPGEFARTLLVADPGGGTLVDRLIRFAKQLFADLEAVPTTRLVRWTEDRGFESAELRVGGRPLHVTDSVHQMGVTKRFVVLGDCTFKFDPDMLLTEVLAAYPKPIARVVRRWLSRPQRDTFPLYLVPRASIPAGAKLPEAVEAVRVELPAEVVHFFVDEDDSDGVVLTVVHQRAMDGAEFVAASDLDAANDPVREHVVGMFPSPVDLNDVSRYVVKPDGTWRLESTFAHPDHTWAVGFGAGRGVCTSGSASPASPRRRDWLVWYDQGFLPETFTRHVYGMYRGYKKRSKDDKGDARTSLAELRRTVAEGGTQGSLFRLDVGHATPTTAYVAEPGVLLLSPQWFPHAADTAHEGYIGCVVFRAKEKRELSDDERTREVWIFDAADLSEPLARYDADEIGWQYTLHTAWLASTAAPRGWTLPDSLQLTRDLQTRPSAGATGIDALIDAVYARFQKSTKTKKTTKPSGGGAAR